MAVTANDAKKREINILLLGETGAGKSTTLNALANYLKYTTIEEAQSIDNFTEIISSQFTMKNPKTGKDWVIQSGRADVNEKLGSGDSVTQAPIGYLFEFGNYVLRVIDTPGIGDTSGADMDKRNFDKIFAFLQHYERLNAILFLVKGTDARKTEFFKYCITELMTHLHKDVSRNIMFCFTYSREADFGPGNGFTTLQSFFQNEMKEVNIDLEPMVNCFFIDNEAYRYLVAKRHGYPFRDAQVTGFKDVWEQSVQQIEQMFENIINLPPHMLSKTLSLNMVRKIITELAEPLVKMEQHIESKIKSIEEKKIEINNSTKTRQELANSLYFDVWDLKLRQLDYPSTVCTTKKCIELNEDGGGEKINYKTRCHEKCECYWVTENIPGQFMLKFCETMAWSIGSIDCRNCGCNWSEHMHISCEYYREKRTVIKQDVKDKLENEEEAIERINEAIRQLNSMVNEYTAEQKVVQDVSAKFAYILSTNAHFVHSNIYADHLDFLIKQECNKHKPNIEPLKRMKHEHLENVQRLTDQIRRGKAIVRIDDVPLLKANLLNLKHHGESFRQILETSAAAQAKQIANTEKKVLKTSEKGNKFYKLFSKLF